MAFYVMLTFNTFAQSPNDILNVLIANGTITQLQADSLRAEAAIKQQDADAARKSFPVNAARQISISGYTQTRYQALFEEGRNDGFDIRRARLDLKGNITPFFGFRLQTEFAGSPKLLDAYGEIKLNDYVNFTIGQFKIPFSLENLASSNKLELIDRSQVVETLAGRGRDVIGNQNGRDIGIQMGGALIKSKGINLVEYRVGIFNGSGINVADTANESKDIGGRLIFNPVKGLSFAASYYNGYAKAIKPASDFIGKSQDRKRFGVEGSYTTTRLALKGEFIEGKDGDTHKSGWYIWGGYFVIPQKLQVVAKYDTFDPDTVKDENVTTNVVAGVNFNFNAWARIQAFYTLREEQGTSVDNDYFAVQFQIGF
jgi:hypothetical protein